MTQSLARSTLLAVDDSEELLDLMARALGGEFDFQRATNGREGLELATRSPHPELILLDVKMPGMDGFEVCRALKANARTAHIPVLFLTGEDAAKSEAHGFELGAVDYVTKPINAAVLRARVRTHLALASRQYQLEQLVQERTAELERTRLQVIRRLARAMEYHESSAVGNRVMRLGQYAKLLSQASGARAAVCDMMMKAAPLHDVGKLGVPAEILRKRDKLSVPDWERIKRHPGLGAEIIGEHRDPLLQAARDMALTHHEHWDGTGYPAGLKGEAIPWPGRLMAIVDAFESMSTTQFYRDALPVEKAAAEIERGAGTRFDPALVEAFRKALPVMRKVREAYSDQLGDLINLDFATPRETP
jgi:putative two-component system response regulator